MINLLFKIDFNLLYSLFKLYELLMSMNNFFNSLLKMMYYFLGVIEKKNDEYKYNKYLYLFIYLIQSFFF